MTIREGTPRSLGLSCGFLLRPGTSGGAKPWSTDDSTLGRYCDTVIEVYDKESGELLRWATFDLAEDLLGRFLGADRLVAYRSGDLLSQVVIYEIVDE